MNRLFIIASKINPNELKINAETKIDVLINLTKNSTKVQSELKEETISQSEFYDSISSRSIKDYTSFVSQLSKAKLNNNKTIRDLQFDKLPIYWLTAFSVKHPYNHWLFNLFLLRNYLIEEASNSHQNYIYLPEKLAYIKEFVSAFYKDNKVKVICKTTNKPKNEKISFIKNNLVFIFKIIFIKSCPAKNTSSKNIFLIRENSNSYLKKIYNVFESNKKISISTLAFQDWYKVNAIQKELYNCKPSLIQLFTTFHTLFRLQLNQTPLKSTIEINDITIDTSIILKEINDTLIFSPHYFYSYLWMKNYFLSKEKTLNIFYEDEFYEIGRVISAAKKNSQNTKITTYGVQHGMFSDFHTVYNLNDLELKETKQHKNDNLPTPDYFITWGPYFSKQFLKNNTVFKNKIKELGNPLYLFNEQNLPRKIKQRHNILYCLTSETLFYKELVIVKKILKHHPNSTLILRNHPNFQFKINPNLFNVKIKQSEEKEIQNDFKVADLVLTSAHSTIFLDAISQNLKVIRLKTEVYDESMDIISPNCITLNKKSSYPLNQKMNQGNASSFLNMDNKKWINLLT
jgi:hypothetical protein